MCQYPCTSARATGQPRTSAKFKPQGYISLPEHCQRDPALDELIQLFRRCFNMSTGPKTQAAFIQGNQSTADHDAPHSSALFYLFQEVSKLASPIHNSFLDTNLPSTWQKRSETFVDKKQIEDAHLQQISCSSCQNLSCMSPYNQMKNSKEECCSNNVPTLVKPNSECNSPWKVLSLINLQCERLLHHSDVKESQPVSESSTTTLQLSADTAATATADVTNQGVGGDCTSVKYTLKPPIINARQGSPADVNPVEDPRDDLCRGASNFKPLCCVKDSKVGCCDLSQTAKTTDALRPELVKKTETAACQPYHKSNPREDKMLENALSQRHFLNASLHTQPSLTSKEATSTVLSKPALTLDHNANVALTTEPPYDSQLATLGSVVPSSQSAPHLYGTTEAHQTPSTQNDKITTTKPECSPAPLEEKSPPVGQLKSPNPSSSGTSEPEPRPVQEEDIVPSSVQKWRTKTRRKQPHPSRSADIQDPHFQGVTFRMDRELDDNREQCRLLITSKYSKELGKSLRKPRLRTRISQKPLKTSSSDEESDLMTRASSKECASCCTRKTPMWRDAEDGTPLCNACGIRYKKYRVRCVSCWHIPKKEGNSNSCCLKCGNFVRLTTVQRKHTA